MGTHIERAMGWGMTWEAFQALTTLDMSDRKPYEDNKLYSTFNAATDEMLTVPKAERGWEAPGLAMVELRLLSQTFTDYGRREAKIGRAEELFSAVGSDDTTHVLFYPSLLQRQRWYRRNDDLDYAFEQARHLFDESAPDGLGEVRDPRNFVAFPKFGFYPWANDLMDKLTGEHVPWDHFTLLEQRTDWAPAVPKEIRWYLKKLNVMDDNGINQLRPMIAQWWD